MRNLTERLPKPIAAQVRAVMHAAYKLPEKDGIAKLKQQAAWLKTEYADARGEPARGAGGDLHRQSAEAHALADAVSCEHQRHRESERCGASRDPSRPPLPRRRDALRWTATGFLEAEKSFRKIQGHRQLWVLATALGRSIEEVDVKTRAA